MKVLEAELLINSKAELGEGPQLFPDGSFRWVDIPKGEAFEISNGECRLIAKFPFEISKILPWHDGFVLLTRGGLVFTNADFQQLGTLNLNSPESNLRCSDGAVLPNGDLLVGVMDRDLGPGKGSLLHIQSDLQIRLIENDCTIPNGVAISPSESWIYWVHSSTNQVYRFPWDSSKNAIGQRQSFLAISEEVGVPDGITVDSSGTIWVAIWSGGKILGFSESGILEFEIRVGCPNVTSCAFDSEDNLVITTSSIVLEGQTASATGGGIWTVSAKNHGRNGLPPLISKLRIAPIFKPEKTAINSSDGR